ncbi:hypothetical protein MSAN_01305300 [Mycena sanguinolenta]|uniref:F-box domain-containing protein n=1 Tax=Mycena sanguinolenta TaxID=230812 RepID=A0A8H6YEN0_9AGAR|nr:hypothetical protein MSAN_01305300 [Mycena sanguinolenta]
MLDVGPRLPPEIVDKILSQFDPADDGNTLRTCALVSKTWLALSRPILFCSVFITPFWISVNDRTLNLLESSAIIRPYVRDIRLCVPPASEWMETNVPKLLAKFPECTTLRLTDRWETFRQFEGQSQLQRYFHWSAPQSSLVARLRRAVGSSLFGRRWKPVQDSPLAAAAESEIPSVPLLDKLHTLYLDFPKHNLPILTFLSPSSFHTLVLTLNFAPHGFDPAVETLRSSLRAAGAANLRTLILGLPWDLRLGRPPLPLSMPGLRTLHLHTAHYSTPLPRVTDPMFVRTFLSTAAHLLKCVLSVPSLEELVIETDVVSLEDVLDWSAEREELDRVAKSLPTLRTVRILV